MRDTGLDRDDLSNWTDEALLAAYGSGVEPAARELMQRLVPRLHAYAMRMLRDSAAAEDIVQETMLRLWRTAPGWVEGQAKVSTWAFRVTGNLAIDQIRRRRSVDLDVAGDPIDEGPGAEALLLEEARGRALREAIAELPDRQATVLMLRHFEGWSNPQIAQTLDIGVEAVESLTARAKRKLAGILGARKAELGYDD